MRENLTPKNIISERVFRCADWICDLDSFFARIVQKPRLPKILAH